MWLPKFQALQIGLSSKCLTLATTGGWWPGRIPVGRSIPCVAESQTEPWRPALNALARWLGTQGDNLPALHIVLSARFVRWQLLPWQPELTQAKERTAYATLRFRETFGRVAETWQVQHALQAPGKVALACAVDAALLETLRSCCAAAGIRLASVTPYFSCAFDRWRNVIQGQTAWFGLIESDNVTLGLLRDGNWIALRNQYLDGAWHNVLPGLMAQMGIPAGLGKDPEPLYLAGDCEEPTPAAGLSFVWLRPQAPMERALPGFRLALGI